MPMNIAEDLGMGIDADKVLLVEDSTFLRLASER
jgi:hypothetical protein